MPTPTSPIRVGLIVSEFFDPTIPGYGQLGGYGMLARHYIAEYLPCPDIEVHTLLGFGTESVTETRMVDGTKPVYLLPRYSGRESRIRRAITLARHRYKRELRSILSTFDVFLSIETMAITPLVERMTCRKLILYLQDPRPQQDWDELDSVIQTDDGSPRPDAIVNQFYERMAAQDRLVVISQGEGLINKARDLYDFPANLPVKVVRNPVVIDKSFDPGSDVKKDAVLYLGRLDPVKRPWVALEVARRMPDVTFYFLGTAHDPVSPYIIYPYRDLPNVVFLGHQSGEEKITLLKQCKILINPSIHEAIPVSFLEALAYGTLIVSCQNPDSITERFGLYTGPVLGDGREKADAFVAAIRSLLSDETKRLAMARGGQDYVRTHHSLTLWTDNMREVIRAAAAIS